MCAFSRPSLLGPATLLLIAGCGGGGGGGGDEIPPDVAAPVDITVEATGPGGLPASQPQIAAFLDGSSASDNEDPNPTLSQNAPATFPLGVTVVTFTYTDVAGNRGSASATVTVVDTVAPVVTAPANIAVEAPGTAAINAFLAASSSTDLVDPAPVVSNDSPVSFPLGATSVIFTHTDASGNAGTASATVTVSDTIAPGVTSPAAITVEATSAAGTPSSASAITSFLNASSAIDAGDPTPIFMQNAPSIFPLGTTLVTFQYTDWAGNSANAVSSVTVVDTTPPVVTAPTDITVEAAGPGGTSASDASIVAFLGASSATEAVDPSPSVSNDAPSTFSLGPTLVTFTYTDANGNGGTGSATVTVADTIPPVVTAPANITVEATDPTGVADSNPTIAAFLSASNATDGVDAAPVASSDAPTTFPLGTTVVTFTYTDASGNAGSQTASVNVVDTVAPVVTAPGDITVEAVSAAGTDASNGTIVAFLAASSSTDAVDSSPTVTNDAPTTFPLGATVVTFTHTDASGNAGTDTATVTISDTTPPVITLIGADPLIVDLHSTFSDPGTNVTDAVSTGLTATGTGVVDTSTVGAYIRSYDVTDGAGNAATTVIRTVNVEVAAPTNVSFTVSGKHLNFTWDASTALDLTRISINPDGVSGFMVDPSAANIPANVTGFSLEIPVHQTDWVNAQYLVEACDVGETQCKSSANQTTALIDSIEATYYIKASNTGIGDIFGHSVALSDDGNTLAVGAPGEGSAATGIEGNQINNDAFSAGAVYVFTRSGTSWSQQAYVKASNASGQDNFGSSVAISSNGNTLAVGAVTEDSAATGIGGNQTNGTSNSGAVYVFTRSGTSWSQQAYVKASNTGLDDNFGRSVALSDDGNTLAVGASSEDSAATGIEGNQSDNTAIDAGAVYVFTRSGTTWSQQAYVKASNSDSGDQFGWSLTLSADGDTLAVGAQTEESVATGIGGNQTDNTAFGAGAVYVFTRSGTTWSQQAYVKASNTHDILSQGEPGDRFGYSLSLSADGNSLAVGAPEEASASPGVGGDQTDNTVFEAGAVYVFTRGGTTWSQQAYVKSSNPGLGSLGPNGSHRDRFGWSLSLSADGNSLAVGADTESSWATGVGGNHLDNTRYEAGAVYVFTRNGTSWSQKTYVKASTIHDNAGGSDRDFFGHSLSLSGDGDTLAVGARREAGSSSGIGGDRASNSTTNSGAVYLY